MTVIYTTGRSPSTLTLDDPEEWRPIPGYEGYYEISDHGRVRSLDRDEIVNHPSGPVTRRRAGRMMSLRVQKQPNGYKKWRVNLRRDGTFRSFTVAVLVAITFIGPKPFEGAQVAHGDGNSLNNWKGNLRWSTGLENNRDRHIHGTMPKGEAIWTNKLSAEAIQTIRQRRAAGESRGAIAIEYGISETQVSRITTGKQWKHLEVTMHKLRASRRAQA